MLAEIYGWFTEGFDTADLKEARHCWRSCQGREGAFTRIHLLGRAGASIMP